MEKENENIDILEEVINAYDPEVMERLLWDHSRPTDENLKNNLNVDGHHHIYWATDMYAENGFDFMDEILVSSITGKNSRLVRPRAAKSREEQELRTREKAEVFTPSWVCNTQNNLVDDAWFGQKGVFNMEFVLDTGRHCWATTKANIPFPTPDGKTWQDYVWDKRLEITCGEAPYLVSRYDTTTGQSIALGDRIGLFDRKMRVIRENTTTLEEWWQATERALKSTYGYEWQGDNLLLAREAMLMSVCDYYVDFCEQHNLDASLDSELVHKKARYAAYLISWNIFQMDGLKMVLPMTCHEEEEQSNDMMQALFGEDNPTPKKMKPCPGCAKKDIHKHNGIPAIIVNWSKEPGATKKERIEFRSMLPKSSKK